MKKKLLIPTDSMHLHCARLLADTPTARAAIIIIVVFDILQVFSWFCD